LAGVEMLGGRLAVGEQTSAFERDVDAEVLPRQPGRITLRRHPDQPGADVHTVVVDGEFAAERAMDGIVLQQVRVDLGRAEIIDADHLHVVAPRFHDSAQHQAADAPKTVDADTYRHSPLPQC
jgi:hypothetical protein